MDRCQSGMFGDVTCEWVWAVYFKIRWTDANVLVSLVGLVYTAPVLLFSAVSRTIGVWAPPLESSR